MARNWFAKAAAVALALAVLAGCGGARQQEQSQQPGQQGQNQTKALTVGMATDVGGLNDDSFNAAAYRGLKRAESELGSKVNVIQSKRPEEYETNLATLMDQGSDLVWGIGALMREAVAKVADQYPDQRFAIVDADAGKPNVASVLFKEEEGSFLMGVIAARTTKTKKVGFVGGMDLPVIHHFEAGFKAGVMAADPSVEVITVYSGKFDDPVKGKSDAVSIIAAGADVIFHAAGATGQGVIEAAKEKNVYAIGVDSDQNKLAPEHVISSMMKRVDLAVFEVTRQTAENQFPGGKTIVLGLKENGVGYSDTTLWEKMPAGTKDEVDRWAEAIKAGQFTVPNDPKQLQGWTVPKL